MDDAFFAIGAAQDASSTYPQRWHYRVWAALLRRSVVDMILYKGHENQRLRKIGVEAEAWLFGLPLPDGTPPPHAEDVNSFESVCGLLGLSASVVRDAVCGLSVDDVRKQITLDPLE